MLLADPEPRRLHPKIQRRRRGRHLAQGGSPGSRRWRNAAPLAQPHPRKRLFALLCQIRLARIPLETVSNLRLPSVSLATPSSSPRNESPPALFVRPVLAPCTFSSPRRSPPRASLDCAVRWTRNETSRAYRESERRFRRQSKPMFGRHESPRLIARHALLIYGSAIKSHAKQPEFSNMRNSNRL
jgi:hypothetical protein